MLITKKLNLLVISLVISIMLGVVCAVIMLIPSVNMQAEKDSLWKLDSAILELRAEVNKLGYALLNSQTEVVLESHNLLTKQFKLIDELTTLRQDEDISNSLEIIGRLYSSYDRDYERLKEILYSFREELETFFHTASVQPNLVMESDSLMNSEKKKVMKVKISNLYTISSVLDSNLSSSHNTVSKQFDIIDKLISAKKERAYIVGILIFQIDSLLKVRMRLAVLQKI